MDDLPLPHVETGPAEDPELFALVELVARAVGTEPPTHIVLVADLNALVTEIPALFRRARRLLVLGLGVLSILDRRQLASVLAHEMAHLAAGHAVYRPGRQLGQVVLARAAGGGLGGALQALARGALEEDKERSRENEVAADRAAVGLFGRALHREALLRSALAHPLFAVFLEREVSPLLQLGFAPDNLFSWFRTFLDELGHEGLGQQVAGLVGGARTDVLDTHPALLERLVAMERMTDPAAPLVLEGGDARRLLRAPDEREEAVTRRWAAVLPLAQEPRPLRQEDAGDQALAPFLVARSEVLAAVVHQHDGDVPARAADAAAWILHQLGHKPAATLARELDPALAEPSLPDAFVEEALSGSLGQLLAAELLAGGGALDYRPGAPLTVTREGVRYQPVLEAQEAFHDPAVRARLLERLGSSPSGSPPAGSVRAPDA